MRSRLFSPIIIVAGILLVYAGTFDNGFITFFDDRKYILDNIDIQRGFDLQSLLWAFTSQYASNWHPVTWLSHMLDYAMFGPDPRGHHAASLLLHAVNSLLLLGLLRRFTGANGRSLFVALLFAVHPLHVESVAWIAERKDVLSGFFALLTLYLYGSSVQKPATWKYPTTLLCFLLGLMAKPMLVTLPLLMLLFDYWPLGLYQGAGASGGKGSVILSLLPAKIPFFLLSFISCLITISAQSSGGAIAAGDAVPFSFRIINALVGYLQYMIKMVWPVELAVFYPLPPTLTVVEGIGAAATLAAISYLMWRLSRREPALFFGWFWYLIALVPVIGLVQVGGQSMADRYTYLPLIGLFVAVAWGVGRITEAARSLRLLFPVAGTLVMLLLMIQTWRQVGYWRNSITLFGHAAAVMPDNYLAHLNLGKALAEEGRHGPALESFAVCRRLRPLLPEPFVEAGNVLLSEGRLDDALERYQAALVLHRQSVAKDGAPENAGLYYNLGLAYGMKGRLEESLQQLEKSVTVRPDFAEGHYNLGIAYVRRGDLQPGIEHLRMAVRLKPGFVEAAGALAKAAGLRKQDGDR